MCLHRHPGFHPGARLPGAIRVFTLTHSRRKVVQREPWLTCFSLGEEIYPMNSKITPAQLSSGVLYPGAKSKALSRIIIFGALIAAFVNVRGAQAR